MRAAIANEGLILLSTFYIHEALRTGQLVTVLADHTWPELTAYAVYPPMRYLSSRVRVLSIFWWSDWQVSLIGTG